MSERLPPGHALDVRIHSEVMGLSIYGDGPDYPGTPFLPYSTEIRMADLVARKFGLIRPGQITYFHKRMGAWFANEMRLPSAETSAHAICLAALKAVAS